MSLKQNVLGTTNLKGSGSAAAAQLYPQNANRAPLIAIYNKRFRRCATSRSRMIFKTKYPNCRHNFGRTRPVVKF